nr:DUF1800 domain-containing protein [Polymorphobacter sp.]
MVLGRRLWTRVLPVALGLGVLLSACSQTEAAPGKPISLADFQLIDRLTWGANATEVARFQQMGRTAWIEHQLRPDAPLMLPPEVQRAFANMPVAQQSMGQMATELEAVRFDAVHNRDPEMKRQLYAPYQAAMKDASTQVLSRSVLRDLYSPDQLREQMTWFWFNHFNVRLGAQPLPVMVRDYVEDSIRPRALGRFCDLVDVTLRHPAMLIYLNNTANTAGKINENYARELMELHTMGVGSGYTQKDVQELARVLTGAGVDLKTWPAPAAPKGGFRDGLFVFDPAKHDTGDKTLLGQRIKGRGYEEISQATGILCRHPATARRISTKIARYLVADEPPAELIDQMTETFQKTDGDITAVLRTMIAAPEFTASLGGLYKDPQHYVLSIMRLGYDGRMIYAPAGVTAMLASLGQPLYGRLTPDGYPLDAAEWSSSGQLGDRFNLAGRIARGPLQLFLDGSGMAVDTSAPDFKAISAATGIHAQRAPATQKALAAAANDREWTTLFLASPEFMRR